MSRTVETVETTGETPAAREEEEASRLDALIDRAVTIPSPRVRASVAALRRKHPDDTPAQILERLEKSYVRSVKRASGAVGATAAVPAVGTGIAALLTTANVATFLGRSAFFVMSVAEVHGVAVDDLPRRRTLLLASLLGEDGARAVQGEAGMGALAWGRTALTRLPLSSVRSVNKGLTHRLLRKAAARGGFLAVGRLAPFGLGAVIGWTGGRAVARAVVDGARDAFGPAPATFASDLA